MKIRSAWACLIVLIAAALLTGCKSIPCPDDGSQASKDCQLANEITLRLQEDSVAGNYTFNVSVENSTATVQGVVPDFPTGGRVIGIVRATPGVTNVINKLLMR